MWVLEFCKVKICTKALILKIHVTYLGIPAPLLFQKRHFYGVLLNHTNFTHTRFSALQDEPRKAYVFEQEAVSE